jgi:hypothetical protein
MRSLVIRAVRSDGESATVRMLADDTVSLLRARVCEAFGMQGQPVYMWARLWAQATVHLARGIALGLTVRKSPLQLERLGGLWPEALAVVQPGVRAPSSPQGWFSELLGLVTGERRSTVLHRPLGVVLLLDGMEVAMPGDPRGLQAHPDLLSRWLDDSLLGCEVDTSEEHMCLENLGLLEDGEVQVLTAGELPSQLRMLLLGDRRYGNPSRSFDKPLDRQILSDSDSATTVTGVRLLRVEGEGRWSPGFFEDDRITPVAVSPRALFDAVGTSESLPYSVHVSGQRLTHKVHSSQVGSDRILRLAKGVGAAHEKSLGDANYMQVWLGDSQGDQALRANVRVQSDAVFKYSLTATPQGDCGPGLVLLNDFLLQLRTAVSARPAGGAGLGSSVPAPLEMDEALGVADRMFFMGAVPRRSLAAIVTLGQGRTSLTSALAPERQSLFLGLEGTPDSYLYTRVDSYVDRTSVQQVLDAKRRFPRNHMVGYLTKRFGYTRDYAEWVYNEWLALGRVRGPRVTVQLVQGHVLIRGAPDLRVLLRVVSALRQLLSAPGSVELVLPQEAVLEEVDVDVFLEDLGESQNLLDASPPPSTSTSTLAAEADDPSDSPVLARIRAADPRIFDSRMKIPYVRVCGRVNARQPLVLRNEELESSGAVSPLPLRPGWSFVCPEVWCPESNKVFTKKNFSGACPLPGEKAVLFESDYWKGRGSTQRFPGFLDPSLHPSRVCMPCCFLRAGRRVAECVKGSDAEDTDPKRKGTRYVLRAGKALEEGREGRLPLLLQAFFPSRSVVVGTPGGSLVKCLEMALGTRDLLPSILDHLTVEDFLRLGEVARHFVAQARSALGASVSSAAWVPAFREFLPRQTSQYLRRLGMSESGLREAVARWPTELPVGSLLYRELNREALVYLGFVSFQEYLRDSEAPKHHDFLLDLINNGVGHAVNGERDLHILVLEVDDAGQEVSHSCSVGCRPRLGRLKRCGVLLHRRTAGPLNYSLVVQKTSQKTVGTFGVKQVRRLLHGLLMACDSNLSLRRQEALHWTTALGITSRSLGETEGRVEFLVLGYDLACYGVWVKAGLFVPFPAPVIYASMPLHLPFVWVSDLPSLRSHIRAPGFRREAVVELFRRLQLGLGSDGYSVAHSDVSHVRLANGQVVFLTPPSSPDESSVEELGGLYLDNLNMFVGHSSPDPVTKSQRDAVLAENYRQRGFNQLALLDAQQRREVTFWTSPMNPYPLPHKRRRLVDLLQRTGADERVRQALTDTLMDTQYPVTDPPSTLAMVTTQSHSAREVVVEHGDAVASGWESLKTPASVLSAWLHLGGSLPLPFIDTGFLDGTPMDFGRPGFLAMESPVPPAAQMYRVLAAATGKPAAQLVGRVVDSMVADNRQREWGSLAGTASGLLAVMSELSRALLPSEPGYLAGCAGVNILILHPQRWQLWHVPGHSVAVAFFLGDHGDLLAITKQADHSAVPKWRFQLDRLLAAMLGKTAG